MHANPDPQGHHKSISNPKLILIRHSLPHFQPEVPASQWQLSEEGFRRASLIPQHLIPYNPSRIISSQELKARQTAQVIALALNLPIQVVPGLHEHERPQAAGQTSSEQFETLLANFFAHPDQLIFGTESADQAYARFTNTINQLISAYPQETLAIVTHGTVISLFVSHNCSLDPFEFWKRLGLPFVIVLSLPDLQILHITESIQ